MADTVVSVAPGLPPLVRHTPCCYRIPKFGECPQAAVWVIDDSMGGLVTACNWHVGALLSAETENLVYRVELPMPGVAEEADATRG